MNAWIRVLRMSPLFFCGLSPAQDGTQPESGIGWKNLVHFEEPYYLPIEHDEPFSIGIEVAPDGSVVSTCSDHPGARTLLVPVVKKWVFEPAADNSTRFATVSIFYDYPPTRTMEPTNTFFRFEHPLTLFICHNESTVLRMNHVSPTAKCKKHKTILGVGIVPLHHGLPSPIIFSATVSMDEYRRLTVKNAQRRLFPNCPLYVFLGYCTLREELAETYICSECCERRRKWFDKHPKHKALVHPQDPICPCH